MNTLLVLIAIAAGEYIRVLTQKNSYMGVSSDSKKVFVVDKTKATKFVREKAPERNDKVKITFENGTNQLFESNDKHLKYKPSAGTSFEVLFMKKNDGSGFALKGSKGCVKVKNNEFKLGDCSDSEVALLAFVDNTSGEKLDEIIRFDKNKRRTTSTEFSPAELKWTNLTPSDIDKLILPFDRSTCDKKCPTTGERVFVKLN
ncbi:uncharacterized protein VICG_01124 [Vittaforma corneae ATCC 50505]|uniref:Uncharacterized protein n=1 Tax=Vittaforma corneae (strain ATCC 50505) TaxID=993615 RepID=L2GN86_VITCO|nr:uncharacterized protein VICG_01124 [Vittaforma corneae ATCC 50505]ELA41772.1 hypothetical protein VICG_01124 [Vittaforma corneae ATCC 50505]